MQVTKLYITLGTQVAHEIIGTMPLNLGVLLQGAFYVSQGFVEDTEPYTKPRKVNGKKKRNKDRWR